MVEEMSVVTNASNAGTNQYANEDMREGNDNDAAYDDSQLFANNLD